MTINSFFEKAFGGASEYTIFVPGRVNLIGEHTDYNGGCVLPHALHHGVHVALSLRDDDQVVVASDRFEGTSRSALGKEPEHPWARYAVFTLQLAKDIGWLSTGANVAIVSNLSDGAGLSSSAALCVAVLKAIRSASRTDATDVDIAQLARRVENNYIGVPCGIMDQMAVAVASVGNALFLDTASLAYEEIALPTDIRFLVIHSGVHRELADGRYKARKEECDQAKNVLNTENLCHIQEDDLSSFSSLPPTILRRVRHCITEHQRTVRAADLLRTHDFEGFGALMQESHASMRDDFEMSLPEIDALVESAMKYGALGARLTGGGFGGCIVAAVPKADIVFWTQKVLKRHPQAFLVE